MLEETFAEYGEGRPGSNPKGAAGDLALGLLVGDLHDVSVLGTAPRPLTTTLEHAGAALRASLPDPRGPRAALTVLAPPASARYRADASFRSLVARGTEPRGAVLLLEPPGDPEPNGIGLRLRDGRVVAAAPRTTPGRLPAGSVPWRQRLQGALKGRGLERMRDAELLPGRRAPSLLELLARGCGDGTDLRDHDWVLRDPGRYRTNKAVLELRPAGSPTTSMIVKLLRDPRDAGRLDREWRALRLLEALDVPDVPRPLSRGEVRGRPYLLQTAVAGRLLRDLAAEGSGGPALRATLRWFHHLAATTAFPSQPGEVARAADDLVERFEALYSPGAALMRRLHRRLVPLRQRGDEVPTVVMHGDAGAWNVLVEGTARCHVLDWEAAEPRGAPILDVLYLMRSYAIRVGHAHGRGDPLRTYERTLLRPSPLADLQDAAVARMADAIRLPRDLTPAMPVLCWLHRAVKEAARRPPGSLGDAHYVQLLERSLSYPTRGRPAVGPAVAATGG